MGIPIKKGVEFDCDMFNVRCKQPCVSGGLRHTDKCPYDNYNSAARTQRPYEEIGGVKFYDNPLVDGVTDKRLFITDPPPKKGAKTMAKNTTTPAPANNGGGNNNGGKPFTPTFRKYNDMTQGEKDAFRQGAKTSENKVKERLGFTKPKN
jgi:hypothetical protein